MIPLVIKKIFLNKLNRIITLHAKKKYDFTANLGEWIMKIFFYIKHLLLLLYYYKVIFCFQ